MNEDVSIAARISDDDLLLVLQKMRLLELKRFERANSSAGAFVGNNFKQIHNFRLEKLIIEMSDANENVVPSFDGSHFSMDLYATKYGNEEEKIDCSYLISNPHIFNIDTAVMELANKVHARLKLNFDHHFPWLLHIRCQSLHLTDCDVDWSSIQNHFVHYRRLSLGKCSAEFLQTLPSFCEEIEVNVLTGTVNPALLWRKFTKVRVENIELWEVGSVGFRKAEMVKYVAALFNDSCKVKELELQNPAPGMLSDLSYLQKPLFKITGHRTNRRYSYHWFPISRSRTGSLIVDDQTYKIRIRSHEKLRTLLEELLYHSQDGNSSNCFTSVPVDLSTLYESLSLNDADVFQAVCDFMEKYVD